MKFACNVSTFFPNLPMARRYEAASKLKFKAVECEFIDPTVDINELVDAMNAAKVQHILINTPPGKSYEFGFATLPGREENFMSSIKEVLRYTFVLNIKKLHILSGIIPQDVDDESYLEDVYVNNLQSVAEMLETHGIVGLITPLGPKIKKNYFLSSFQKATKLLDRIDKSNIKLLLDIFNLYDIEGTMENLEKYYQYAGHVQLSQSPNRTALNSAGNIDCQDVLKRLKNLGHEDYVGLDYFPTTTDKRSLNWLKQYGYRL